MGAATPESGVGIAILAAGESHRMGEPKQLLQFRGVPLLRHAALCAVDTAAGPVVAVLGAFSERIRPSLEGLPVAAVENPDWREGMGTSLRCGLRSLLAASGDLSAVLFVLTDQPMLSAEHLRQMVTEHRRASGAIIASEYSGTAGVPALFPRKYFSELLNLAGSEGARKLIAAHRSSVRAIAFPEGAVDVDTPADYAQLTK